LSWSCRLLTSFCRCAICFTWSPFSDPFSYSSLSKCSVTRGSIIISCIHCSLILQQYYEPLLLKCYLLIISEFKVIQEKRNFNRRTYRNILYLINFLQLNHLLHLINILQVHIIHLQHWFDLFWYNHHMVLVQG